MPGETLVLDLRFPPPVGRLKKATGTTDENMRDLYKGMCRAFWAAGATEWLVALKRPARKGGLTFAEAWGHYKPTNGRTLDVSRLPSPATLRRLWLRDGEPPQEVGALAVWMADADVADATAANRVRDIAWLKRLAKPTATVGELPAIVRLARTAALKRRPQPRVAFNALRLTAQAFLRDTLGKRHPLYQDVLDVPALTVERAETSGLSVADAIAVREALTTTSPAAAAAWWALCLTGMRPAEYWQTGRARWELRSDRIHVVASKASGDTKKRPVPIVERSVLLHPPAIEHSTFRDDMWKLRAGKGPFRTPWPTRITPYVARRTFAHWMELALIPRSRRMIYRGSGPKDVTDLYELGEVAAFLAEDAAALRAFIGFTDGPRGLTLLSREA